MKVVSWKWSILSLESRLTLIRHVLSCMLTHTLAVLPVPRLITNQINSILSSFLRGENNGRNKKKMESMVKTVQTDGEGVIGVLDLGDLKKLLHIKFV